MNNLSCIDIDECAMEGGREGHHCGNYTRCVNVPGSYECHCLPGYIHQDNYTCVEHDECATGEHDCGANARCHNTDGGYQCLCLEGYRKDGNNCTRKCDAIISIFFIFHFYHFHNFFFKKKQFFNGF